MVEQLANAIIHLRHGIGKISLLGCAGKISVRKGGKVEVDKGGGTGRKASRRPPGGSASLWTYPPANCQFLAASRVHRHKCSPSLGQPHPS